MIKQQFSNLRHVPMIGTPASHREALTNLEVLVGGANASVYPAQLAEWWREIADHNLALGRYENAMAAAQRALGYAEILFDPVAYGSLLNLQGCCLLHLGDHRAAAEHFHRALKQASNLHSPRFNLATLALEDGHLDEAQHHLEHLVRQNPNDAESLNLLGVVFYWNGDLENAERRFNQATTINRDLAAGYFNRSILHLERDQLDSAYFDCSRATVLDPKQPSYWNNRGVIHARLGKLTEAVHDFSRAISLDYGYVGAFLNRALALAEQGRTEHAEADLVSALRLNPRALDQLEPSQRMVLAHLTQKQAAA